MKLDVTYIQPKPTRITVPFEAHYAVLTRDSYEILALFHCYGDALRAFTEELARGSVEVMGLVDRAR